MRVQTQNYKNQVSTISLKKAKLQVLHRRATKLNVFYLRYSI